LKTPKLQNSKIKKCSKFIRTKNPPPLSHQKEKMRTPQNDKKIEDPQKLKKQKIPQSSQNKFFLKQRPQ